MKTLHVLLSVLLLLPLSESNRELFTVNAPRRVHGTVGSAVVLPCYFTFPYASYTTFEITVIWKIGVFYTGTVLFNATNRAKGQGDFENMVQTNINDRYRLVGDPRIGNASVEIKEARLDDTSEYFCRVEVKRPALAPYMKENNLGTILKITGPPVILNMSTRVVNGTQFTLVCHVQGEPSPKIMWIDPQQSRLPMNASDTPVVPGPGQYQVVGELRDPKLGGNYTCVTTNTFGNSTQVIYFASLTEGRSVLKVIIGALVGSLLAIILIIIALTFWRRRKGILVFTSQRERCQPKSTNYCEVKMYHQQATPEETSTVPESPEVNGH
ncbi:sialic acid-binding Ig-like lectin 15 [Hemiscyllium ocellatum]|uniref:sialic acid-binding Ig-like lectin 15 n=1 Tax=Hemiscyllium ocellatum TaxID=170820 RepID=UPI002966B2EA|nr:sialic acid-binding Ig-like lectin 15 [Hemiscyllium ocellatum]